MEGHYPWQCVLVQVDAHCAAVHARCEDAGQCWHWLLTGMLPADLHAVVGDAAGSAAADMLDVAAMANASGGQNMHIYCQQIGYYQYYHWPSCAAILV